MALFANILHCFGSTYIIPNILVHRWLYWRVLLMLRFLVSIYVFHHLCVGQK